MKFLNPFITKLIGTNKIIQFLKMYILKQKNDCRVPDRLNTKILKNILYAHCKNTRCCLCGAALESDCGRVVEKQKLTMGSSHQIVRLHRGVV